jgi:hypothetical protein
MGNTNIVAISSDSPHRSYLKKTVPRYVEDGLESVHPPDSSVLLQQQNVMSNTI